MLDPAHTSFSRMSVFRRQMDHSTHDHGEDNCRNRGKCKWVLFRWTEEPAMTSSQSPVPRGATGICQVSDGWHVRWELDMLAVAGL